MKKKILFLCTYNSARSQIAEGLLRALGGDSFEVYSAGTYASSVNPLAITAMQEIGIDISQQQSKTFAQFVNDEFDYVVTLCDSVVRSCPIFPHAASTIHWDIPSPSNIEQYRKIRDILKKNIQEKLL